MKSKKYLFSCFLWFQEEVFTVKKRNHPGSVKIDPDPDPDPGSKKTTDPATPIRIRNTSRDAPDIRLIQKPDT
jgi:hypothetical protein